MQDHEIIVMMKNYLKWIRKQNKEDNITNYTKWYNEVYKKN